MLPVPRLMPALVTPFTAYGDLDIAAHERNVAFLAERGLKGLLIAGSTGEGPYLEVGERAALLSAARRTADSYLLCGINAETHRMAAAQIAEAADGGADAVLVITPTTLVRNRRPLVEGFFLEVAERAPLPVLLYTVPPVTGYELPVESVAALARHGNIVGMKDSGGDTARFDPLGDVIAEGFMVFIGASRAVHDGLQRGAYGAITASANYAHAELERLIAASRAGDGAAGGLQEALTAATAQIEPGGVPATKAAAAAGGLDAGHPRPPLQPVDRAAADGIAKAMAQLREDAAAITG